jgi:hypothetical protein
VYEHVPDSVVSDKLLLAILKAFVLLPLNKHQTLGFHVFMYTQQLLEIFFPLLLRNVFEIQGLTFHVSSHLNIQGVPHNLEPTF